MKGLIISSGSIKDYKLLRTWLMKVIILFVLMVV